MKVNLIYDMRKGLNDWLDDFTDEERGDAVLTVLDSARNKEEYWKIEEGLKSPEESFNRDKVNVREMLTELQKVDYENLKLKFNV